MRAINIGIGHDDNLLIAQPRLVIRRPHAAAQRQHKVGNLLALLHFCCGGIGDIEDFAAQGQNRLVFAVTPLFGTAARAVALDDKKLCALAGVL